MPGRVWSPGYASGLQHRKCAWNDGRHRIVQFWVMHNWTSTDELGRSAPTGRYPHRLCARPANQIATAPRCYATRGVARSTAPQLQPSPHISPRLRLGRPLCRAHRRDVGVEAGLRTRVVTTRFRDSMRTLAMYDVVLRLPPRAASGCRAPRWCARGCPRDRPRPFAALRPRAARPHPWRGGFARSAAAICCLLSPMSDLEAPDTRSKICTQSNCVLAKRSQMRLLPATSSPRGPPSKDFGRTKPIWPAALAKSDWCAETGLQSDWRAETGLLSTSGRFGKTKPF